VSVEPDEGTRVHTQPPRPAAVRERTVLPPAYAAPQMPAQPVFAATPPAQHVPDAPPAQPTVPRRPGAARRFFRALWDFVVTMAVMALFVGSWALAGSGVLEGERERVYAGAAATVIFTPMAIHRLTGSRGRYALTLFGSIVASLTAVYYVGRGDDADPAIILVAMFGLQVVASFVMARLTRRKEPQLEAGY
ncbi:MAG TPA: hypothetical protein VM759_00300, partial [Longimicrobium sp.]|nr:hypothetical protein [Longimicrobium sp.]